MATHKFVVTESGVDGYAVGDTIEAELKDGESVPAWLINKVKPAGKLEVATPKPAPKTRAKPKASEE